MNEKSIIHPTFPLSRIIREGVSVFCVNCNSTMSKVGLLRLFGKRICDNKKCVNMSEELNFDDITKDKLNEAYLSNVLDKIELEDLLIRINKENKSGNGYLDIYDYHIDFKIKKELERRGFEVNCGGRYNEIDTTISWR